MNERDLLMVVVSGPTVTDVRNSSAEFRVTTTTGRRPSGPGKLAQTMSPCRIAGLPWLAPILD